MRSLRKRIEVIERLAESMRQMMIDERVPVYVTIRVLVDEMERYAKSRQMQGELIGMLAEVRYRCSALAGLADYKLQDRETELNRVHHTIDEIKKLIPPTP
jgi:hypothetical protein